MWNNLFFIFLFIFPSWIWRFKRKFKKVRLLVDFLYFLQWRVLSAEIFLQTYKKHIKPKSQLSVGSISSTYSKKNTKVEEITGGCWLRRSLGAFKLFTTDLKPLLDLQCLYFFSTTLALRSHDSHFKETKSVFVERQKGSPKSECVHVCVWERGGSSSALACFSRGLSDVTADCILMEREAIRQRTGREVGRWRGCLCDTVHTQFLTHAHYGGWVN